MSSFSAPYTASALASLLVLLVIYIRSLVSWKARSRGRSLPPGPRGLPLIGNMFNMPISRPWVGFRDLCAQHGSVLCMRAISQTIIVLGSPDVIFEFLDRRSANTSDRVFTPSLALTSHEWAWGFWEYSPRWRHHRRVFWQHFHPAAIKKYNAVHMDTAHAFLAKLLKDPTDLKDHIRYTFSAALLKITYGIDAADENDETLALIASGLQGLRQILVCGGGFQTKFAQWGAATTRMKDAPVEKYMEAVERNETPHCMFTDMLTEVDIEDAKSSLYDPKTVATNVAATVFNAGSDTSFSSMETFFLAMSLYPDVQQKAQAELDAVVGRDRMPESTDRDSLVYVNAIIKEALRWINVTPLGLSHSTIADDELKGYFIPAGAVVMVNIWACMHDPDVYDDPDVFRPERFIRDGKLDPSVQDPVNFVFGFGRRICPGRHFADAALFINIASVLHVFNVTPPVDESGKEIKVEPTMADSFISMPADCRCTIKSRGSWAEDLIRNVERGPIVSM